MKKVLSSVMALAMAALTFTACSDVPSPYEEPGGNTPGGGETSDNVIFSENFANGQGGFTFSNVSLSEGLTYVWKAANRDASYYLYASAYANNASHAAEAWAVSPAINLGDCTRAKLSFKQAINKLDDTGRIGDFMTVWASTDFTGDAANATWTKLTVPNYPAGNSWSFVESGDIDLSAFCGKQKVYIGYKYKSEDGLSGAWEVSDFQITGNGTPMTPSKPDTPDTPDTPDQGKNLLANGDFETWTDGLPVNWKTTTSAGNATLSQSTDAHGGQYSVCVGGAKTNKRLAYKETTLKAGTYKMTFYGKAATADGASVEAGYAVVTDGKVNANGYQYSKNFVDMNNTSWIQVSHEFTLSEQTTVCLLVMNSSKPGKDVLIDDFTLTTTDGGIVSGGSEDKPSTPTEGIFSETFANGIGNFTIQNVNIGSLSYVWKADTQYGYMKASAFLNKTNHAAESWLVSPAIDLDKVADATLTFSQALNFLNGGTLADHIKVMASTDYSGDVAKTSWTELSVSPLPAGNKWDFTDNCTASLKAFAGKKGVHIAFKYVSTEECAPTWEVKNLVVK